MMVGMVIRTGTGSRKAQTDEGNEEQDYCVVSSLQDDEKGADVVDVEVWVEGEADEEQKELGVIDIVVEPQVDGERAMVTGPFSLTGA